jgi:preprotein translocase subunit SecG
MFFLGLLLFILVVVSVGLTIAILMQAGKGGGLAANFGGAGSSADAFLGSRQATTVVTKASWIGGGVFLFLAFVLSLAYSRPSSTQSALERAFQQTPQGAPASVPAPAAGGGAAGGILTPGAPDTGGASKTPTGGKVPPP